MLSRTLRTPWWLQAGMAIVMAVIAFALTLWVHLEERPFLLPMIAVLIVALRLGFAAGFICTVATLLLANYYIIPPAALFGLPAATDAYELGVFFVTATIISVLAARRRQAQLTLEATLASIGDGVIVTDAEGRVRFLNSVGESITGWTLKDAAGKPVNQVFNVVSGNTRNRASNAAERALRDGMATGLADRTVITAKDGTERPIADSGAPIRDYSGRTIGAVLVFRDASLERNAESALKRQAVERQELLERERAAREDAERANRLKDEFLATLSHELRTPLNAVLGWSHMLNRRQLTSEQQKQALAAIYRNAQAQARLVDDVLDLSRIVTGRLALTAETVDVSEIVRTTAESFTPAVLGKRQDLRLDLGPEAEITGDPHRLRQIIWNLLSNATKFTPEGGIISCRVAAGGERVELTVTDTGQGIEPGFLPFVFDRFRQADSSSTRGHGGLGLGLALVRYLVEAHGGTVYATSGGTDKGTTIVVKFPARVPQPSRVSAADFNGDGHVKGRRILVLEDDDDARTLATAMLESLGASVNACASAEEALESLARQGFDLIVADLAMPGTDGYTFLREVRKRDIDTPALAVTGYSDPRHRQAAYDAGFGAFVSKPMTPENLLAALRSLMQTA